MPSCRRASPSPAPTGTHTFAVTLDTAGTQSITATDTVTLEPSRAPSRGSRWQAAAAKTLDDQRVPDQRHGGRRRCTSSSPPTMRMATWRPAIPARSLSPAATRRPSCPSSYTLRRRRRGHAHLLGHPRYRRDAVDHGDRYGDASLTATESSIAVQPAAATILTVTGFPTSDMAGTAGRVTVSRPTMPMATWRPATPARSLSEQRSAGRSAVWLLLHRRRCGCPYLLGHARDSGDTVDHRDRYGQREITGTESGITVRAIPQSPGAPRRPSSTARRWALRSSTPRPTCPAPSPTPRPRAPSLMPAAARRSR